MNIFHVENIFKVSYFFRPATSSLFATYTIGDTIFKNHT